MKNKKMALALVIAAIMLIAIPTVTAENSSLTDETIILSGEIKINGQLIQAPMPYIYHGDADIVMVPLRAVAESLGYTVLWEFLDQKYTIVLGYGIQMWIGVDYYRIGLTNVNLYPAPELVNGSTFVSLDFFEHVLGYDAYISNGTVVVEENLTRAIWVAHHAATVWFAEDLSNEMGGALNTINVGKTPESGEVFALARLPLGADWFAGEVSEARLFLKVAEGTPPNEIYIGAATQTWTHLSDKDRARSAVDNDNLVLTEVRREANNWVSMDVSDIVVRWLNSEIPNRGFTLLPGDEQALGVFVSGNISPVSEAPRLVVSGEIGERPLIYGRFGFTRQPAKGAVDPMLGGNCLSYALRDLDGIYNEDLNTDFEELARIYAEYGLDGVLEHTAVMIEKYVEAHKEALQISGFRRIDAFDSPIDPETEYRIVLRVAIEAMPDGSIHPLRGYDFHFWVQLNDGRWTQKNPSEFSEIIPYVGPGVCPVKFYWNAGSLWGVERYQEKYTSNAVFFAVTKDTDEFTRHKQEPPEPI